MAAAEAAVARASDAVTDMAYFPARDHEPADYCQAQVRACDVYVGLIGLRYGSPVRDRPGVSYTELEFETATSAGLPRLVFLLDEEAALPIPAGKLLDGDPCMLARQRAFRNRLLGAGIMVAKVASPEQLEVELLQALQEGRQDSAAPGLGGVAGLPALPDLVGRDREIDALAQAWLASPPRPVAVLGAPGIGKSAICLAALHDRQVRERFGDRRWFVRCDGAASAGALLSGLAAELGVSGDGPPGTLLRRICAVLGAGMAVVVLDNFETPWTADPLPVEELLRTLGSVPQAAVTVSARGTARPAGLRWRDFAMLGPLPMVDARRLFLAVAGTGFAADPRLDGLLVELDGVPLAVELMGYAAQGQPGLDEVAARWRTERTGMLQRMGGASRELSIAVSVETSVASLLMTRPARRLLALLGVLPDGVSHPDLGVLLPVGGLAAAAVLRQLGLAFDESTRLRMLAPIREHTSATHLPGHADLDRAVTHYAELAAAGRQVGRSEGAQAVTRLQAETGNITAMLERAIAQNRVYELTDAMYGLVEYWRSTGFTQPTLARAAQKAISTHGTALQQAGTWFAFGTLAMDRSDYDGARAQYERALPLFERVGSVLGEANCIKGLGDIALRRSDHDGARAQYERALPLFERVGSVLGEANCIQGLGDIALRRSDHDGARAQYERALPLYRQVGSVLGEANCIQGLGDIALRRSDHDGARAQYERALPLYRQVGDVLGEANCIQALGDIALRRSDHDGARAQYERALPLFEQAGSVLGEANCIKGLGDIALRRSDHDGARAQYERALPLFERAGSVLGEANCIQALGDIALARSDHDGARAQYERALPLFRQVGDVLGEASCIKGLGDIALARSDHDGARAQYERALPLFRQVGDVLGEASCIKGLGDIALARSDHDGARAQYERALPLFRQVGDVLGEASCIKGLGDIALARSDHDGARAQYERALPLYQAIPEPFSVGWTLVLIARLDPPAGDRTHRWIAARKAWASIGRDDLIESIETEFQ